MNGRIISVLSVGYVSLSLVLEQQSFPAPTLPQRDVNWILSETQSSGKLTKISQSETWSVFRLNSEKIQFSSKHFVLSAAGEQSKSQSSHNNTQFWQNIPDSGSRPDPVGPKASLLHLIGFSYLFNHSLIMTINFINLHKLLYSL